jgi:hypothetical protein
MDRQEDEKQRRLVLTGKHGIRAKTTIGNE